MSIISYLKNPIPVQKYSKWQNIYFLKFILIFFIFSAIGGGLTWFADYFLNVTSTIKDIDFMELIIPALVVAPIGEELMFRLLLKKGKYHFKIFIFSCAAMFVINYLAGNALHISTLLIVTIMLIGLIVKFLQSRKTINIYSNSNFKYLFYGSVVLFGLVHGVNYNYPEPLYLFAIPFIVVPQYIAGILLGYIRIQFGLRFSIAFHFLINLIGIFSVSSQNMFLN